MSDQRLANAWFVPTGARTGQMSRWYTGRLLRLTPDRGSPARVPLRMVPVSIDVRRESEPSDNYMATLSDSRSGALLAVFSPTSPNPQWFERGSIYLEVLATAYEYTEPRLGMTRWPTISEDSDTFLFNISEGAGESQVSTVPATLDVAASVGGSLENRLVAVAELMDDGQWRIAGYGHTTPEGPNVLDLEVTTSGRCFAICLDDFGRTFVPRLPVAVGDRVRPTIYRGWVYRVTEAGNLPETEPLWWPAIGDNVPRLIGTTRVQAVRYYQPLAHGPVPVKLIEP